LINLTPKFIVTNSINDRKYLIYTDLFLKQGFEHPTLGHNAPRRSVVNSACGSARDRPYMCLRHPPFGGRS